MPERRTLSAGYVCDHCDQLLEESPRGLVIYDMDGLRVMIHALCLVEYCGSRWSLHLRDTNPDPTLEV